MNKLANLLKYAKQFLLQNIKSLLKNPVFLNVALVGSITIVAKALGFYKEIVVAANFGLSVALDTFFIAFLIPSFIQNVFINALKNVFIPNYIKEKKLKVQLGAFQSIVFLLVLVLCIALCIVSLIFAEYFLELAFRGHDENYYQLIRLQLYILLPCVFFWGVSSILGGLLEIDNKYFFASFSSVFIALSVIVSLLYFKEEMGEFILAKATLVGSFISFLVLLSISLYHKIVIISFPRFNANTHEMLHQFWPKVSSGLLSGLNNFVDQFFAAQLVVGSITALNYGLRIPAFLSGIVIIALGNVLLPHFSRLVVKDLKKAYKELFFILKLLFISALIAVVILILFSQEIISLFFERNEFTADDSILVSQLQTIAFIYVPFYICTLVLVRFLTSINKNAFMAWISFFSLITNIILNSILIKYYGVHGLVWATTIIYIFTCITYLTFTIKTRNKLLENLT